MANKCFPFDILNATLIHRKKPLMHHSDDTKTASISSNNIPLIHIKYIIVLNECSFIVIVIYIVLGFLRKSYCKTSTQANSISRSLDYSFWPKKAKTFQHFF